jgi:hypothetical protein
MRTLNDKPIPTHREELPVRECRSCGCYLRSYQESTFCDPCGTPAWEIVDEEVWARINDCGLVDRKHALEALGEIMVMA